ncbi:hypothetical protein ACLSU7_06140 [Bdellovibrio sp. HCB185ZH]|uniref:hypothetical protein n=1 Tax=Bdellovibrio sp. HCB185ZH TaxID=3394235 RepID=UPI0039A6EBE7
MKLIYTAVAIFMLNLPLAKAGDACSKKLLNESQLEYQFKDRKITIIGWTHELMSDQQKAMVAIQAGATKIAASDCEGGKKIIQDFLTHSKERLAASNKVEMALETLYMRSKFKTLGVEFSKENWAVLNEASGVNKVDRVMSTFVEKCPNLKTDADEFLKIFPGPHVHFAKKMKGKIQLMPMENEEIKAASLKGVSAETLNFDPDTEPGLSPAARSAIGKIQISMKKGETPVESDFQEAINAETNPTLKAKLQRIFKDFKIVWGGVEKRNDFIAKTAVEQTGDVAMLMGQAHVKGLGISLDHLCQGNPSPTKTEKSTSKKTGVD